MNRPSPPNENAKRPAGPASAIRLLPAALILLGITGAVFLAWNGDATGVRGRDAGHHALTFVSSLFPGQPDAVPLLVSKGGVYGPGLRVVSYPAWSAFGHSARSLLLVNYLLFLATCAVGGVCFRRMGVESDWGLVFGLVLFSTLIGQNTYLGYDIDAAYTLGCLAVFAAMLRFDPRDPATALDFALVFLLAALVRLNSLFYTALPCGYVIVRSLRAGRVPATVVRAVRSHPVRVAFLIGLLAVTFYAYSPRMFLYIVKSTLTGRGADLGLSGAASCPGVWTACNLFWYVQRLPVVVSRGLFWLLLPALLFGLWAHREVPRWFVVAVLAAPVAVFTLGVRSRYMEYVLPTIAVGLVYAVAGIAACRVRAVRAAALAAALVFCAANLWRPFGLDLAPTLGADHAVNRWARALAPESALFWTTSYPGNGALGPDALVRVDRFLGCFEWRFAVEPGCAVSTDAQAIYKRAIEAELGRSCGLGPETADAPTGPVAVLFACPDWTGEPGAKQPSAVVDLFGIVRVNLRIGDAAASD